MRLNPLFQKFSLRTLKRVTLFTVLGVTFFSSQGYSFEERAYLCKQIDVLSPAGRLKDLFLAVMGTPGNFTLVATADVDQFLPDHGELTDITPELYNLKNRYVGHVSPMSLKNTDEHIQNQGNWLDFIGLTNREKLSMAPDAQDSYSVWMSNIMPASEYFRKNVDQLGIMDRQFLASALGHGRFIIPKDVLNGKPQSFPARLYIQSQFSPKSPAQGVLNAMVTHNRFDVICATNYIPEQAEEATRVSTTIEKDSRQEVQNQESEDPNIQLEVLERVQAQWFQMTEGDRHFLARDHKMLFAATGIVGVSMFLAKSLRRSIPLVGALFGIPAIGFSMESMPPACASPSLFENIHNLPVAELRACINGSGRLGDEVDVLKRLMELD